MGPPNTSLRQYKARENMASLWFVLALVSSLLLEVSGTNPGVIARVTQNGLNYGRSIGIPVLQESLKSLNVPDQSGTVDIGIVGDVSYSLTGIRIVNVGLSQSSLVLAPGAGMTLSISNAFIDFTGNWRVKYLGFISDSGSFDLSVGSLAISTTIVIRTDETGRPTVSSYNCVANVGQVNIKFHGGASWLYNLFDDYIDDALRGNIQGQICPLVAEAVDYVNPHLKTLNVLAQVDQYAEIEYSMVESPSVSSLSIDLGLKGEFYNVGHHQEPPYSPTAFSLPHQDSNMLYIAVSAFTANTAGFVYNNAGVFNLYITDDMIPSGSPFRLDTKTFGTIIPQIAKMYPGLVMKLLVNAVKQPTISFAPDNVTLQASGEVTAYAIQPNSTLTPLFVLNVDASVSAHIYMTGGKVGGMLSLNSINMTLGTTYVGPFEVKLLDDVVLMVLKVAVIPKVNAWLEQGFPLPTIGNVRLVNTQLEVLKDILLIGTDIQFTR